MRSRLFGCLVAAFLAVNAHAVDARQAQEWQAKLATTTQMLKDGAYDKALPILHDVTMDMLGVLGPGDATTYVLSVPLIQTAIAEAGLNDRRAALWHWDMAQTLYPQTATSDLSMFGAPGEFLKQNLLSNPRPESCPHPPEEKEHTQPKPLQRKEPLYPDAMRVFREKGIVIINLEIGTDGLPTKPRVVKPLATPLNFAALEALRQWTFTPAQKDGAPVDADYCITINFILN